MRLGVLLLLLTAASTLGARFEMQTVHPVILRDGESVGADEILPQQEESLGTNFFLPFSQVMDNFEDIVFNKAGRLFQQQDMEMDVSSEDMPLSEMVDRVASNRFQSAMNDLQQFMQQTQQEEAEGEAWDPADFDLPRELVGDDDYNNDWLSSFLIPPLDSILSAWQLGRPVLEKQPEEELTLRDSNAYSTASQADQYRVVDEVEDTDPSAVWFDLFNDGSEAPTTTQFSTVYLYSDDRAPSRSTVYDTNAALQRLAYEQWRQEQGAMDKTTRTFNFSYVLYLAVLFAAMLLLFNFVYNWRELKAAMRNMSSGQPPETVAVMFQHNGRLVRGWMAKEDLKHSEKMAEMDTAPLKSEASLGGVPPAGAKQLDDLI